MTDYEMLEEARQAATAARTWVFESDDMLLGFAYGYMTARGHWFAEPIPERDILEYLHAGRILL